MPRVSVLTPLYNTNPEHLRECIESILNQTFTDFEFLILNDSPDNTELDDIVNSYKDSRIKYIKNDRNIGISASRNKLVSLSSGDYLAVFDHDDISLPNRLELEVNLLDTNPYIGVVSGIVMVMGGKDDGKLEIDPETDAEIKVATTYNCSIHHTASMMRKSVLVENNIQYEEYYSPAEDYRLWARLMDITHFHNLPNILVKYRHHENRTSKVQEIKMYNAWRAVSLELRDKHPGYWGDYKNPHPAYPVFRLRLFGKIPLLKIKRNWVFLFECIPILKIRSNY